MVNLENLKDLLTKTIKSTNENSIKVLIGDNPHLKYQSFVELEIFLNSLKKKAAKIARYISNNNSKNPLIINSRTPNFSFTYTVNPDLTSAFKISVINQFTRTYDADFLKSKIKKIEKKGYVYFLKSEYGIKIGYTKNLTDRLNLFGVKLPFKTELHSYIYTSRFCETELFLHNLLADKRLNGEWFDLSENDFIEIDKVLSNLQLKRIYEYSQGSRLPI